MLVNFALDCVGTTVSCDKVSTDGYECTNLVSSNWQERKKGFIAEHFIKPPVNITFSFPCNIEIYQVLVTPYVGQQLCSQVEIYSASRPVTSHKKSRGRLKSHIFTPESTPSLAIGASSQCLGSSSGDNTTVPLFYQISRVSVPNYGRISFTNPSSSFKNGTSDIIKDASFCPFQTTMQHFRREILTSSTHLSVRLVRTEHGSSVAVSNVDIWGLPALSLPPSVKDEVLGKFKSFLRPEPSSQNESIGLHTTSKTNETKISKEQQHEEKELVVQEEFIDPITCEVMSIPMLLPCGKNVDKSSLDRFFDCEEIYGRVPRDPFTGVVFSNTRKPLPNIALKSRIDQFLIKHSNNKATASVARTVDSHLRKRDVNGQRKMSIISSLVPLSMNSSSISHISCPSESKHIHCNISNEFNPSQKLFSVKKTCTNSLPAESNVYISSEKTPPSSSASASSSTKTEMSSSLADHSHKVELNAHEHKLRESLSSALTSLLGNSSSSKHFPENSSPSSEEINNFMKCSMCTELQPEHVVVYNSPCNHTICRQCLTNKNLSSAVIKCGDCGQQCKREDFVRKHFT
ncbi:RING finger protein 37 [Plakobranchus ocellatus]|uniref:RING finger protein 37 n=1 Tax=Plakobranchus ocellatus TaxID=259542 RepID=A0AAV4DW81_9GAST|nr:RING finger protein 37 [Plakobranchus ocellatus]